jgi:transaldolase
MKFFIDTANLDQIREAQTLGVLDGVTTNPSLMAKEGITGEKNILKHYVDICNIVDGDVSAEVIAVDLEGMIKEGEALANLHPQIVVKIPMIEEGVKPLTIFLMQELKPIAPWFFLLDKPYWRQKQEQPMFLPLLVV